MSRALAGVSIATVSQVVHGQDRVRQPVYPVAAASSDISAKIVVPEPASLGSVADDSSRYGAKHHCDGAWPTS
jgi:hypothetical protein